jgi:hypothetical protein
MVYGIRSALYSVLLGSLIVPVGTNHQGDVGEWLKPGSAKPLIVASSNLAVAAMRNTLMNRES